VSKGPITQHRIQSPSDDPRDHDNLRSLWVKLLQSLDQLAHFDAKSCRTPGALAYKDVFCFANRGERFSITGQGILFSPAQAIIPAF
jgi:hypothetical protein